MKKFIAILIAIAFIAIAAMPVMAASTEERITAVEKQLAASWKFYGSVRMGTFYANFNPQDMGVNNTKGTTWALQTNARIGARVTTGDISGHFEYGHNDAGNGVTLRHLYATWNFGPGRLLIGQDWTPLFFTINNRVFNNDSNMFGAGQIYGHRRAQINLKFGDFQFAFIDPTAGITGASTQVLIPRLEAKYDFKFDAFNGAVMAGYKTYKVNTNLANENSVTSYIFGLGLKYVPGPFYAGITGFYAQNHGNFAGVGPNTGMAMQNGNVAFNGVKRGDENAKTWGAHIAIGYKVNDMITMEAGYGHQEDKWSGQVGAAVEKNKADSYYINVPITVAKNFWITPEFGMENTKSKTAGGNSAKLGRNSYFGAKWQMNF